MSEEHDNMEDEDVDITLTTKGQEADALKEMLRKRQEHLKCFVKIWLCSDERVQHSTDLIKSKTKLLLKQSLKQ